MSTTSRHTRLQRLRAAFLAASGWIGWTGALPRLDLARPAGST